MEFFGAFLTAFGWASDKLFRYLGIDEAYRDSGHSFFTVETHLNNLREASLGDTLQIVTQVLGFDDKRLHIFHTMRNDETGELLATTEQMLLHVDNVAGRTAPILTGPTMALRSVAAAHSDLPVPRQVGRVMALG